MTITRRGVGDDVAWDEDSGMGTGEGYPSRSFSGHGSVTGI